MLRRLSYCRNNEQNSTLKNDLALNELDVTTVEVKPAYYNLAKSNACKTYIPSETEKAVVAAMKHFQII